MSYVALIRQAAEGCDYTIGCGLNWLMLKATTREAAIAKLHELIIGKPDGDDYDGGYRGDDTLSNVTLLDVSEIVIIPVEKWYAEAEIDVLRRQQQTLELQEKQLYKQLRAKWGHV